MPNMGAKHFAPLYLAVSIRGDDAKQFKIMRFCHKSPRSRLSVIVPKENLPLIFDEFLPRWNYRAIPRPVTEYAQVI